MQRSLSKFSIDQLVMTILEQVSISTACYGVFDWNKEK
jgi:hypothetical protein